MSTKGKVAKDTDVTPVSAEEAARILSEERTKRVQACQMEIKQVLQRHKCTMLAEVRFQQGSSEPLFGVKIVPTE